METNEYDIFNDIVKELLSGEKETTMANFSGASLEKFAEHSDVFWDGLLEFMQNEADEDRLDHYGIRDVDLIKSTLDPTEVDKIQNYKQSVGNFINQNADLADKFLDACLVNGRAHWNESFDQLLDIYWKYFIDRNEVIDSTNISVKDLVDANAGNSFNNRKWVIPWKNIDNKTYSDVRDNDKIKRVLNDKTYLQFTHLFEKYLRLLMPEYERIVEVEDLNRNFWVIGQVLTGICSFLFDEKSPLNQLFDGFLDEITQLWENMLYLWIAFALMSQLNRYKTIQPIVIPLNNDLLRPYVKFDDFGSIVLDVANVETKNGKTLTETQKVLKICWDEHLNYLKQKYGEDTLVIIPEIRQDPYYKNYYAKSYYPGIIIYNRRYRVNSSNHSATETNIENVEINEVTFLPFLQTVNNIVIQEGFVIDLTQQDINLPCKLGGNNIFGVYEKSPNYYFKKKFTESTDDFLSNVPYFGSIRTLFSDMCIVTKDQEKELETRIQNYLYESDSIESLTFKIKFQDIGRELSLGNERGDLHDDYFICKQTENGITISPPAVAHPSYSKDIKTSSLITKGMYLGENPSWYNVSNPKFDVKLVKRWVNIPIEGFDKDYSISITALGHDSITDEEYRSKPMQFTLTTEESKKAKDNEQIVEKDNRISGLIAYDSAGQLINYNIIEEGTEGTSWDKNGSNTVINFESDNRQSTWENKWSEIEYDGKASQINFNIVTVIKGADYTGNLASPHEAFAKYMSARRTGEISSDSDQKEIAYSVDILNNTNDILGDTYSITVTTTMKDGTKKPPSYGYLREYIDGTITNSWDMETPSQTVFFERVHSDHFISNEAKHEQNQWDAAVQHFINTELQGKDNIAKLYYSHYQFSELSQIKALDDKISPTNYGTYFSLSQSYECSPFITLVTKLNGEIAIYSFDYQITGNNKFNNKIDVPHMTSTKDYGLEDSYNCLCAWLGDSGITSYSSGESTEVSVININGEKSTRSDSWKTVKFGQPGAEGARKGNLIYGINCEKGVRVYFEGGTPYLQNYLLLGQDRTCSGINALDEKGEKIDISKSKYLYPYYYKCSLLTPVNSASIEHGIIKAEMVINPKGSNPPSEWGASKTRSFYNNNKPDPAIWQKNAQGAIGKIEEKFLSGSYKLVQEGEHE